MCCDAAAGSAGGRGVRLRPTAAANGPASAKSDGATSTAARAAAATAAFARPCRPECQSGLTRLSAPAKGTPPTGRATMGRARCCPKEPSRCPRSRARCASSVIRFRVCRLCIMSFVTAVAMGARLCDLCSAQWQVTVQLTSGSPSRCALQTGTRTACSTSWTNQATTTWTARRCTAYSLVLHTRWVYVQRGGGGC